MTIAKLINRPCTITRGIISDDDFGLDAAPAPGATVTTVCEIQQRQRTENGEDGEVSRTDWIGFFLPDETLHTADKVTVDSLVYEVVGDPWMARHPLAQTDSHMEASLRRTAGSADVT